MPVDAAEDEYAVKLPVTVLALTMTCISAHLYSRVCGSMDISHDQLPKHIVKCNRAFLSGLDAGLATHHNLFFTHLCNRAEQMRLRFVTRVSMVVRRRSVGSKPGVRPRVQNVVKERPVD